MVIMKGDPSPEHMPPPTEVFRMMGDFNQKLAEAGVLIDANGLQPSAEARRVTLAGADTKVIDGPFTETKELLSGYWTLQVDSFDEAIDWMQQSPLAGSGMELELRKVGEMDDFGESFTDEVLVQHVRVMQLVRANAQRAYAYLHERAAVATHEAAERTNA
jgi:hypothetical protein